MAPPLRISLICLNNGVKPRMAKPPKAGSPPAGSGRPRRTRRTPAPNADGSVPQSIPTEPTTAIEASSNKINASLPPETTAQATKPTVQIPAPPVAKVAEPARPEPTTSKPASPKPASSKLPKPAAAPAREAATTTPAPAPAQHPPAQPLPAQ